MRKTGDVASISTEEVAAAVVEVMKFGLFFAAAAGDVVVAGDVADVEFVVAAAG